MFFAPPQVKSLSRYSEYGTHLQDKHFIIMLGIAVMLHVVIIAILMMAPREEVMQIPVRVLNVKLGDMDTSVNTSDMPQMPGAQIIPAPTPAPTQIPAMPAQTPAQKSVREETQHETTPPSPQTVAEKPEQKTVNPANEKVWLPSKSYKKADTQTHKHQDEVAPADTLAQPKHYVRENDLEQELVDRAAQEGKTSQVKGSGGTGSEAIERYEQVISIWLAQHKTYPEAAKSRGIEGDAVVRIRINRRGKILYYGLERSSGTAMIDEAVMAMVKASDPVPAVPEDYPEGNQLEFLIPVTYRLK